MNEHILNRAWVAIMCLAWAPLAAAQPVGSFAGLQTQLKIGDEVRVIASDKTSSQGSLLQLSADSLEIEVFGQNRRFTMAEIYEVGKIGDSLQNGILIGLGIGLGAGAVSAAVLSGACDTAGGCGGEAAQGIAVLGGFGAGIGALVDYLHKGYTVLYRRARPASTFAVHGSGKGVAMGVVFTW